MEEDIRGFCLEVDGLIRRVGVGVERLGDGGVDDARRREGAVRSIWRLIIYRVVEESVRVSMICWEASFPALARTRMVDSVA